MSKKISMRLSTKSIDRAIAEIERYQKDLHRKMEELVRQLALIGLETVNQTIAEIPIEERGDDISTYASAPWLDAGGHLIGAAINLTGSKVLFIEFSAGIRWGTDTYPTDAGAPYGMGTYPGKGHWNDPNGWYYFNEDTNRWVHSYGNRAYMPMYHAEESIMLSVEHVARQVFGG